MSQLWEQNAGAGAGWRWGCLCPDTTRRRRQLGARALTHIGWGSGSVSFPCCGPGGAGRGGRGRAVSLLPMTVSAWPFLPTTPMVFRGPPTAAKKSLFWREICRDSQVKGHLALSLESLSNWAVLAFFSGCGHPILREHLVFVISTWVLTLSPCRSPFLQTFFSESLPSSLSPEVPGSILKGRPVKTSSQASSGVFTHTL